MDGLIAYALAKKYTDEHGGDISDYLPLSGGEMTGDIEMGLNGISFGSEIAKIELDTGNDLLKVTTGGVLDKLMVATPQNDNEAANKGYVDSAIAAAIGDAIGGAY